MKFRFSGLLIIPALVLSLLGTSIADELSFDSVDSIAHAKDWEKACKEVREYISHELDVNPNVDARYAVMPSPPLSTSPVWMLKVGFAKIPVFPAPHYHGQRISHERDRVAYTIRHGKHFSVSVLVTPSLRTGAPDDPTAKYYPESYGPFEMQLDSFKHSLTDLKCHSAKAEMRTVLGLFMKQVLAKPNPEYKVYSADLGKPAWLETFRGEKNDHYYFQANLDDGHQHIAIRYDFRDHKLYEKAAPYLWAVAGRRKVTTEDSPAWLAKLDKSLNADIDGMTSDRAPASVHKAKKRRH